MLSLLIFIGEGVRDAFVKKDFRMTKPILEVKDLDVFLEQAMHRWQLSGKLLSQLILGNGSLS